MLRLPIALFLLACAAAPAIAQDTMSDDAAPVDELEDSPAAQIDNAGDLGSPQSPGVPAPALIVPRPPLSATMEIAIGFAPTIGFGTPALAGLGSLGSASLLFGGDADFLFSADPRFFLGLGLRVDHRQAGTSMTFTESGSVEVPLIAQIYFDTPRRGGFVPTLRIIPAFRWQTQSIAAVSGTQSSAGGSLELAVGVTWFVLDQLAIRFLGDLGGYTDISYTSGQGSAFGVFIGASVGLVIRL